jgi:chemotaxis protein CheX
MNEKDLTVFIDGAVRYFDHLSGDAAEVGTPYLMDTRSAVGRGLTGIIGVTGHRRGHVYFTAPSVLVKVLLLSMGESDTSQENMCDAVGEVANTISGNARKEFGKNFMISEPIVICGNADSIALPSDARSYVVPISWRGYEAGLVISLS